MNANIFGNGLLSIKYCHLNVEYERVKAYYQDGHIIITLDYNNGFSYNQNDLMKIIDDIGEKYGTTRIMVVIFTYDSYTTRIMTDGPYLHWIYDVKMQKLLIFDDQPDDFYGIKGILEEKYVNEYVRSKKYHINKLFTVTNGLILVNVLVYIILLIREYSSQPHIYDISSLAVSWHAVMSGRAYTIVTSMFTHAGIRHLGSNMLVLFFMGNLLERNIGHIKYLIIYFISGIGGGIIAMLYYNLIAHIDPNCVGASGAIFGIIGAVVYRLIKNKGKIENLTLGSAILYVIISVGAGLTASGVSVAAHLGGLVTGFAMAYLLREREERHES